MTERRPRCPSPELSHTLGRRTDTSIVFRNGTFDAVQNVLVKLPHQDGLEPAPQWTWPEICAVGGTQNHLALRAAAFHPIRATVRPDTSLDAEPLLDDVKLQQVWCFDRRDALDEIAAVIRTADQRPDHILRTVSSNRIRQRHAKQVSGTRGHLLVEHDVPPHGFGTDWQSHPRGDGLAHGLSRTQPADQPIPLVQFEGTTGIVERPESLWHGEWSE